MKADATTLFIGGSTIAVIAALVTAISVTGTPAEIRLQKLDERRVQDLTSIGNDVRLYVSEKKTLPASLTGLQQEDRFSDDRNDPVTKRPYEYRDVGDSDYELCATFDTESQDKSARNFWAHKAGRNCFTLHSIASAPYKVTN